MYVRTHTHTPAESIQMLALDPSPKVAKLGRDVLRISQYELSFMPLGPTPQGSGSISSPQRSGSGPQSSLSE